MDLLNITNLEGTVKLICRGKVRDVYELAGGSSLLFVATDRISAYDVIMGNGVPNKGKILTALSEFWFHTLQDICENHLVSIVSKKEDLPNVLVPFWDQLDRRSMIVKKLKILPFEAIVRGYITGSAWNEYKTHGTVHGILIKPGMLESEAFDTPIFTPSTKAKQGEHDENIHPDRLAKIIGASYSSRVEKIAIKLYTKARDYAALRGIIIADTKFEFGVDENDNIILVDEVLTPDSSRFWLVENYAAGRTQESYDKQYLRDWLTSQKLQGESEIMMPEEVAHMTSLKYIEAFQIITGMTWGSP